MADVSRSHALVSVHESFSADLGTLALRAHDRGEHERMKSLVCAACRTR